MGLEGRSTQVLLNHEGEGLIIELHNAEDMFLSIRTSIDMDADPRLDGHESETDDVARLKRSLEEARL